MTDDYAESTSSTAAPSDEPKQERGGTIAPPSAPPSSGPHAATSPPTTVATATATATATACVLLLRPHPSKPPKKPRDMRLRDCFEITPVDGGCFDRISCRYCTRYVKVLQKFNPTKARVHLTTVCDGTDEALRHALLSSTQAAKRKSFLQGGGGGVAAGGGGEEEEEARATTTTATATGGGGGGTTTRTGGFDCGAAGGGAAPVPSGEHAAASSSAKKRKLRDRCRPCPVYLSFRTDADDATAGGGLVSFSFRLATYCSLSGGAPP